jgi:hypothetical protein
METETRFDLNAAIADWQRELAAQPDLTPVVRKELETHLRDTIAELQGRGLNNEESFWLARRRVGRPQHLGEEFAKTDPANAWRERSFWVVVGLLLVNLWGTFIYLFQNARVGAPNRVEDILPGWIGFYLPNWLWELPTIYVSQLFMSLLQVAPIFLLVIFLGNYRLKFGHAVLNFIVASRTRFVWVMVGVFLCVRAFAVSKYGLTLIAFQLPWVLSMIALAAWLIPSKKETAVKTA